MRVLFMGTPDFAAASLQALLDDGSFELVGVFTQPDRPKNRGMKLEMSDVKKLALAHELPVYQPEKLRDGSALEIIRSLAPDVIAVVAYGRILPVDILQVPPMGCINIHGSILPKYRGSAPIQHAVLHAEEKTGVTAMYMAEGMDTGDMIEVMETEIGLYETSGQLFDRLAEMGGRLLCRTLHAVENGCVTRTPQDEALATYAPPISKDLCPIDWNRSMRAITAQVCGLHPWPVATATFGEDTFKIHQVKMSDEKTDLAPGSIVSQGKDGLHVACGDGVIVIEQLQAPGGKRMNAADYLRGHSICR